MEYMLVTKKDQQADIIGMIVFLVWCDTLWYDGYSARKFESANNIAKHLIIA